MNLARVNKSQNSQFHSRWIALAASRCCGKPELVASKGHGRKEYGAEPALPVRPSRRSAGCVWPRILPVTAHSLDLRSMRLGGVINSIVLLIDALNSYASGRVAVCVSKINDYQSTFQFYEDNARRTLLATLDEHAVRSPSPTET